MKRLALLLCSLLAVSLLCAIPVLALPCPTLTTLPATNISYASATLNGQITGLISRTLNGQGNILKVAFATQPTSMYFAYGTSADELVSKSGTAFISGVNGMASIDVTGLLPGTTYYAQAVLAGVIDRQTDATPTYLTAMLLRPWSVRGAGVGLGDILPVGCFTVGANTISFTTLAFTTPSSGQSSSVGPTSQTATIANIVVQSAKITSPTVGPGETVTVTSSMINKGNHDGSAKVTLYVNGVADQTKGISMGSGQSSQLTFAVTRSDPGTYDVRVNNVPAGSFTVDVFHNNDFLMYGIIAFAAVAIGAAIFLLARKPQRR